MNVIKLRLNYSIFIIIVAFLYSNFSYSQNITFELLDSITLQPVSDANVIYSFTDDINSGSQYGFSDSNGLLLIKNVPDTIKGISIQIFQLNYKALKLTLFKEDLHKEIIQIQLSPKTHQLGEIRIVGKAINMSNEPDTITVVVDSLKTISTPGIKDVLLKIDKLTINENSITYDGKIISKVFLDGVDLTGDSYMTLVDAINANIIDEVDIIKNFYRNPILKDFETEETIINLRTDKEVPVNLSGEGRLGVADKGLLNLDLNLVGITPRLKFLSRFTKNNIAAGVYQPSDLSNNNEIQSGNIGNTLRNFQDFVVFAPIKEKLYRVERENIGGTVSFGGRIGKNWVFRSSSYLQESTFDNQYSAISLNYLPDTTYLYSAIYYSNMRNKLLRSEFETEFSNDQVFFNFKLDGDIPSADNYTSASFSGQLMDSLGNRIRLNNAFYLNPSFSFSKKLNFAVLDLNSQLNFTEFTENWNNSNFRTSLIRDRNGTFSDFLSTKNLNSITQISLKKKINKKIISAGVGYEILNDKKIYNSNNDGQNYYGQTSTFKNQNLYAFLSLGKMKSNSEYDYNLSMYAGGSRTNWQTKKSNQQQYLNPYIKIEGKASMKFNKWSILTAIYTYSQGPINANNIQPYSVLTPQYLLYLGYEGRGLEDSHNLILNYVNKRIDRLYDFDVLVNIAFRPNAIIPNIFNYLSYNEIIFGHQRVGSQNFIGNWTKSFLDSKLFLKGRISHSRSIFRQMLNSTPTETQFNSSTNEIVLGYRSGGIVILFPNEIRYTRIKFFPVDNISENVLMNQGIEFNYLFKNEKFKLNAKSRLYYFGKLENAFTSLDLTCHYFINSKLRLQLIVHNILDNRNFNIERITPNFENNQNYLLRPRFIGVIFSAQF